jgi:hypothetical protein
MLDVVILNVVMLSVIMLNVAAPMNVDRFFYFKPTFLKGLDKLMKTLFLDVAN